MNGQHSQLEPGGSDRPVGLPGSCPHCEYDRKHSKTVLPLSSVVVALETNLLGMLPKYAAGPNEGMYVIMRYGPVIASASRKYVSKGPPIDCPGV